MTKHCISKVGLRTESEAGRWWVLAALACSVGCSSDAGESKEDTGGQAGSTIIAGSNSGGVGNPTGSGGTTGGHAESGGSTSAGGAPIAGTMNRGGSTTRGGAAATGSKTGAGGSEATGGSMTSIAGSTANGGSMTGTAGATSGGGSTGSTGMQPLGAICANDGSCSQSAGNTVCCRSSCTLAEQCPTSTQYLPCNSTADCSVYGGGKLCCEVMTSSEPIRFCTKQSACSGKVLK
jgi:hypothetical protein